MQRSSGITGSAALAIEMGRKDQENVAKNNKQPLRGNRFLSPTQQWLALTLLAVLAVIAIFYFGIGFGGDGGQPG